MEGGGGDKGRLLDFKNKGKDEQSMRGKRREHNVELRKSTRADQILKKRQLEGADLEPTALTVEEANALLLKNRQNMNADIPPELDADMTEIVEGILDDTDLERQHASVRRCRKLLSRSAGPPIKAVISTGIVPKVVAMLAWDHAPLIQFEAAWVLTNIASGSSADTATVYDSGAMPLLLNLFQSTKLDVREQAVWAIGNIVGDGPQLRDKVMQAGGLESILHILQTSSSVYLLRHATWTLSNFCRGKDPRPDFARVSQCIPILYDLVRHDDDPVKVDAVWAVSYLSDNTPENIQVILQSGIHQQLLPHLRRTDNADLLLPVLRALGNITAATNEQTQVILNMDILPMFPQFLAHLRDNIRKEAAWLISNVAAGTPEQIQYIIDIGLIEPLVKCYDASEYRVRKEVAWAFVNIAWKGTRQQVITIASAGALRIIIYMLRVVGVTDSHLLDGLFCILRAGATEEGLNPYVQIVDELQGVESLERLVNSGNDNIAAKAATILDTFFREEDVRALMPAVNEAGGQFAFMAPSAQNNYQF